MIKVNAKMEGASVEMEETEDHDGCSLISEESVQGSKKRKHKYKRIRTHENESTDSESSSSTKGSIAINQDDECDDGAFCPIVSMT